MSARRRRGHVVFAAVRAPPPRMGHNDGRMPVYSLHYDGPQQDQNRDVVGARARIFSGASYVNFVSLVSPGADVRRLLPNVDEALIHAALAHVALPHIQEALASKRLPLADPTMAFEVRVPAQAIEAGLSAAKAWIEPLNFEVSASRAAPLLDIRPSSLTVRNLVSFGGDGTVLDLGGLTVLVGPNGAGKTNLMRSFRLLRDLHTRSLHSAQRHRPVDGKPCGFGLQFGLNELAGSYTVDFELTDTVPVLLSEQLLVGGEVLLRRTSAREVVYRSAVETPDRTSAVDIAHYIPSDWSGFSLLGREAIAPVVANLRKLIYDASHQEMFHRRDVGNGAGGGEFFLNTDGSNAAAVITRLLDNETTRSALVAAFVEAVGPGADLLARNGSWQALINGEIFDPAELSHGTRQWLQLMAMVIDPLRPEVLLIDEPEIGLHPDLLFRFANYAIDAAKVGSIVLATHSINLLDHLHLSGMAESVRVVENVDGSTEVRSIESALELDDVKELLVGTAWASGLLGGNPL